MRLKKYTKATGLDILASQTPYTGVCVKIEQTNRLYCFCGCTLAITEKVCPDCNKKILDVGSIKDDGSSRPVVIHLPIKKVSYSKLRMTVWDHVLFLKIEGGDVKIEEKYQVVYQYIERGLSQFTPIERPMFGPPHLDFGHKEYEKFGLIRRFEDLLKFLSLHPNKKDFPENVKKMLSMKNLYADNLYLFGAKFNGFGVFDLLDDIKKKTKYTKEVETVLFSIILALNKSGTGFSGMGRTLEQFLSKLKVSKDFFEDATKRTGDFFDYVRRDAGLNAYYGIHRKNTCYLEQEGIPKPLLDLGRYYVDVGIWLYSQMIEFVSKAASVPETSLHTFLGFVRKHSYMAPQGLLTAYKETKGMIDSDVILSMGYGTNYDYSIVKRLGNLKKMSDVSKRSKMDVEAFYNSIEVDAYDALIKLADSK